MASRRHSFPRLLDVVDDLLVPLGFKDISMIDEFRIDAEKLSLHPQRVAQWLDAGDDWEKLKKVYPLYIEISPVGSCNHRCTFCSVDYIGYVRRSLDYGRLGIAIADMARNGVKSIMFAGEGEPLLHRDIGDLINHTKLCGIDVAITTNATGLTSHLVEQCLHSVTWLKASINGGIPALYAAVHKTKAQDFHRVIGNLAEAVKIREESRCFEHIDQGGQPIECTLGAQIVLLGINFNTVVPLAKVCQEIGLDYLVVKPYSQNPNSTETAERGYDQFDYQATTDLAEELAKFNTDKFKVIYRERTMASLASPERAYSVCHATPFFWAYVMATGDVYGCSAHLLNPDFCFGNINEQTFSEIWEGERRRKCVEMMRNFDLSVCRKNCRMEHSNRFLWQLTHPAAHSNFI